MSQEIIVGRTALVDLNAGEVHLGPTPRRLVEKLLGGRGGNMAYLGGLLSDDVDPLGPDNVLVFGAGLLTGYPVPNSGRMNISARSPESYILGDANMGGFFPTAMRRSGFDRLVMIGRSSRPVFLYLTGGRVEIRDAGAYWGLNVPDTLSALRGELGPEVSAAVIGPAGENLVRFACVINGRKNAAGRGGMGAVMGSKNLKAVAAAGDMPLLIADPDRLRVLRQELTRHIHSSKIIKIMGKLGTPLLYEPANKLGVLRTKNSQLNQWAPNLNATELEKHVERMVACAGCTVHCRHVNKYGGEGPEFVTLALLGANAGIDDLVEVIKLNNLCNDLGLDTSSAGSVIPWAMELYQRGIITDEITGGPLEWGDVERVRGLLEDIAMRRNFGDVLAESGRAVSLGRLPHEALPYLPAIKGLPQSDPHDPRYIKSFALGEAVSTRGADHLRNRPTMDILRLDDALRRQVYGADTEADPTSYRTKELAVEFSDNIFAVCDSLGICRFVCRGWNSPKLLGYEHFAQMIESAVGLKLTTDELRDVGRRVIDLERLINHRYGMTRADDTLPQRYFTDPMPGGVTKGHRIDPARFEALLSRYYQVRGWDAEGRLTPGRRAEIERLSSAVAEAIPPSSSPSAR